MGNLTKTNGIELSRRRFVKLGAFGLLAGLCPTSVFAKIGELKPAEKSLSLFNPHTEESLDTVFWADGEYLYGPLTKINYFMRDFRTGEIKSIDTRLLELLHLIQKRMNANQPLHIISGYRSPETNDLLRKKDNGVSRKSLHMFGKAVDICLPDVDLLSLRNVIKRLRVGGVGYYPKSGFIHADLGRPRYWTG